MLLNNFQCVQSRYHKYSTDEQIVGEWIDGKPIYQKTINVGGMPNTGQKEIAHGINNFKKMINGSGYAYDPVSGYSTPLIYTAVTGSEGVIKPVGYYFVNATHLTVGSGDFDFSAYTDAYVTIQYIKTTD